MSTRIAIRGTLAFLAALLGHVGAAVAALTFTPAQLDFGAQSMMTTSPPLTVTMKNSGAVALTVNAVTFPYNDYFKLVGHTCTTLAPGANCAATLTFTPPTAGPLYGYISIGTSAGTEMVYLTGNGEQSFVMHYYRSILRREPEPGGKAYWDGEAARLASLGANPNEAWYAMALSFFFSAEYRAFNRNPTEFLRDLYTTFFNRAPDDPGIAYWTGQMAAGMPAEAVLVGFIFSPEFTSFTRSIFGDTTVRAELDTATDFYRGLLGRPADTSGFDHWVTQFRIAQCQGPEDVYGEVEAISNAFIDSAEYAGRNRSNSDYVTDLYNSFLRRGADLPGVLYWIGVIETGAASRADVRRQFIASPEFKARVDKVVAAGCVAGVCRYSPSYPSGNLAIPLPGSGVSGQQIAMSIPDKCGWTFTHPTWIHPDRTAGVGSQVITFSVDANPGSSQRTGNVMFKAPGATIDWYMPFKQAAGVAPPPPPPPPPITDGCLLAGYCRSNGVCCARGLLGCGNLCYTTTGAAYRGGGCTSFYTFCPN